MSNAAFRPFTDLRIDDVLDERVKAIAVAVAAVPAADLCNRSEDELAHELTKRLVLTVPAIDFDAKRLEKTIVEVPAERFPIGHGAVASKVHAKAACLVHLPYVGDPIFLRCYDYTKHLTGHHQFSLEGSTLTFEIFDFELTRELIEAECAIQLRFLSVYLGFVASAVHAYNEAVPRRVREAIAKRKRQLVANAEHVGVAHDTPPRTRRRIEVTMTPGAAGGLSDPTLDPKPYGEVLHALASKARALHRTRKANAMLGEEDVRDHLLEELALAFEDSSATGETFAKSGKTDIVVRHEGHDLFVAECRFWNDEAAYLDALTELLGRCTTRECKMALLLFVRGLDFTATEATIRAAAPSHPSFVREDVPYISGVVRYTFEVRGSSKHAKVAVLLFHLPM